MKPYPLIDLLKTFSKQEIRDFNKFLSSPYFNTREAVRQLYTIISKSYPDFNEEGLEVKILFSKLSPGKKFNRNYITVMMHYLYDLAKKFITYRYVEDNFMQYTYDQLSELHNRRHFTNFEKTIEQAFRKLDPRDHVTEQYYFHRYKLKHEKLFYLSENSAGVFEKILGKAGYEDLFDDLTLSYYFFSIRLYLNILNLEKIYKKEFRKTHFEKMISNIDSVLLERTPLLKLYYSLVRMITTEDDKFYFESKKILPKLKHNLNFYDLSEIYVNQLNFCTRKILSGNTDFTKEKFEVCRNEIETGTYLVNGVMSPVYYKQVVTTGLQLNQFRWVNNFIEKFKAKLEPAQRENTYLYCKAFSTFKMKDFDGAMNFLSKIKFTEVYQNVDIRMLQMMIYYETGAFESLYSSLEAFRHFLSNNKLMPAIRKRMYNNFYRYLKKLLNVKQKNDEYELSKLKTDVSKTTGLPNIEWLLSQLRIKNYFVENQQYQIQNDKSKIQNSS